MSNATKEDTRPAWPHKEMSEIDFRAIRKIGFIVAVEGKWAFTGEDTSREWLEVTDQNKKKHVLPSNWKAALKFAGYASVPGLFEYTYEGERMAKTADVIDAWEKKNQAERLTYERLRKKFGATNDNQEPTP